MIKVERDTLLCPVCEEEWLHQRAARVVFRDGEDGPGSLAISTREGINISRVSDSEIPGRRDAIEIDFSCEICEDESVKTLLIMQHKGQTVIDWK